MKRRSFLAGLMCMGALAGTRLRLPAFVPAEEDRFIALGQQYAAALARSMVHTKEVMAANVLGRVYA
jgi:hypothetical protein